jgi:hypothetical protein
MIVTAKCSAHYAAGAGKTTVDPSAYALRITLVFEIGSEKYGWLNPLISVGVVRLTPTGAAYIVYAIL